MYSDNTADLNQEVLVVGLLYQRCYFTCMITNFSLLSQCTPLVVGVRICEGLRTYLTSLLVLLARQLVHMYNRSSLTQCSGGITAAIILFSIDCPVVLEASFPFPTWVLAFLIVVVIFILGAVCIIIAKILVTFIVSGIYRGKKEVTNSYKLAI